MKIKKIFKLIFDFINKKYFINEFIINNLSKSHD